MAAAVKEPSTVVVKVVEEPLVKTGAASVRLEALQTSAKRPGVASIGPVAYSSARSPPTSAPVSAAISGLMNTSDWPMPVAKTSRASNRSSVSRDRCDRVSWGLFQWKLPNMERNKRCRDRRAIRCNLTIEKRATDPHV